AARDQRQPLLTDVQGNDFGAARGTDLNHETSYAPGAQYDGQISRSDIGSANCLKRGGGRGCDNRQPTQIQPGALLDDNQGVSGNQEGRGEGAIDVRPPP